MGDVVDQPHHRHLREERSAEADDLPGKEQAIIAVPHGPHDATAIASRRRRHCRASRAADSPASAGHPWFATDDTHKRKEMPMRSFMDHERHAHVAAGTEGQVVVEIRMTKLE